MLSGLSLQPSSNTSEMGVSSGPCSCQNTTWSLSCCPASRSATPRGHWKKRHDSLESSLWWSDRRCHSAAKALLAKIATWLFDQESLIQESPQIAPRVCLGQCDPHPELKRIIDHILRSLAPTATQSY